MWFSTTQPDPLYSWTFPRRNSEHFTLVLKQFFRMYVITVWQPKIRGDSEAVPGEKEVEVTSECVPRCRRSGNVSFYQVSGKIYPSEQFRSRYPSWFTSLNLTINYFFRAMLWAIYIYTLRRVQKKFIK